MICSLAALTLPKSTFEIESLHVAMAAKAHSLACQLKSPEFATFLEELVRSGIVCLRTNFNHKARGKWKMNGWRIPQSHFQFFLETCLSCEPNKLILCIAISIEKRDMIANILSWFPPHLILQARWESSTLVIKTNSKLRFFEDLISPEFHPSIHNLYQIS